jgi:predicted NAD/FAD-binding protein
VPVDTGFIVFNERNYVHLTALFERLGVATRDSDMSFAVSLDQGAYEYAGDNLPSLFAQRRNLLRIGHWRMLSGILKFNREAGRWLAAGGQPGISLGEYLDRGRYGNELRHRYLLPMGAAIWSCPVAEMLEFPAASFLAFFRNHGLLEVTGRPQWKTVTGGSHTYVRRMLADLEGNVRLDEGVTGVRRTPDGVRVRTVRGGEEHFDAAVMACHADQSLALLEDASRLERNVLGAFRYQRNHALLHSDPALMPSRRRAWSSWNYLGERVGGPGSRVSVTYWMNRLQRLTSSSQYFVTLNPLRDPAPGALIYQTEYDHPVYDRNALEAQGRLGQLQGRAGIWFCGGYCGYGFHEDALASAVNVAAALGVRAPWQEAGTATLTQSPAAGVLVP